jgi:AmiR/NasT family two-component response regulator
MLAVLEGPTWVDKRVLVAMGSSERSPKSSVFKSPIIVFVAFQQIKLLFKTVKLEVSGYVCTHLCRQSA